MTQRTRLGRYDVLGQLAIGGMAEILLGCISGPSGFRRPVVVKRILPHLAKLPEFRSMFLDEARIVARIHHENVVQVHELVSEGDSLYLVMEYLNGESVGGLLRRLALRDERLPHWLAAHVVAEACAGLHSAQELTDEDGKPLGLVHRDVSPQNVFVTYDGGVKLLDFGIAKIADRSTRTATGHVKGKFQYMSPEQCRGEPLDRRSDVFALGSVLYELTTSTKPFKRATEHLTFLAICEEPLLPPSRVVESYPRSLEPVVLRALSRDRRKRYATALEMRQDLVAALRELEPSADARQALADSMHREFSERIAEKRELLRLVGHGSVPQQVPDAEVDAAIDLPAVTDLVSAVQAAPPRRLARSWWWLAAALVPLAGAATFAPWPEGARPLPSPGAPSMTPPEPRPNVAAPSGMPPEPTVGAAAPGETLPEPRIASSAPRARPEPARRATAVGPSATSSTQLAPRGAPRAARALPSAKPSFDEVPKW